MNFSVVIPLYNKAPHIERALRSVLAQTCQDFEIVVVNDGSTDRSREVVESISDSRIRLINQPNQGVSAARNRGVEAAHYEFVAFLDADDEWLPAFLSNIQMLINNFPDCGAYATAIQTVRPNGDMYYPDLSKLPPEPWIGILPNFFELFQGGLVFHPSSIVIPKPVFADVGGFPVGVKLSEDVVCFINIAIRYPIVFTPKRLVIYHQDAFNRSNINKIYSEEPFIRIVRSAINDGIISPELENDALEFVAQKQIFTAKSNVMAGNSRYAKELLFTCVNTRKYKREWLYWRLWALFPAGWPGKFLLAKQRFFR